MPIKTVWVPITVRVVSGMAILCEVEMSDEDQWIATSLIEDQSEPEDFRSGWIGEIEIPEWLAVEKGMV